MPASFGAYKHLSYRSFSQVLPAGAKPVNAPIQEMHVLMTRTAPDTGDWHEERLRYQVLRFIFDRVGSRCDVVLTGPQIGGALALGPADVLRIVAWLDEHGYVHHFGDRPSVCLTPQGVAYLESSARRRRSLRS